ncbi:non-specific lipid-transfer protein 1-like [Phoenix dactylifera]|uniref:Non-specific lipid-transfer protein n=1 Tax=Phoenix dactylifera TaxID=42345 RepID=A0A8B7CGC4_PHODC|nr:non-specific lipid-transfer protein 1-like [Phoenix dactylifera]
MAGRRARSVVGLLLAMVLLASPRGTKAITCPQVYGDLTPCIQYLRSGGAVAPQCCSGVRSLLAAARTVTDRRTACRCIKTAAAGLSGLDIGRASALPGKCGVSIPYKISPSTDCSKIN